MSTNPSGNCLIAKNATMLYLRMFFTMAISLYTSRVVLKVLGVSDYGVYNLVGGITVLINVVVGALGSSTSRFLTYVLGKDDVDDLQDTFSTAAMVHIGLAFIFVLLAETVGLWFVNTQLVIPAGRMGAANWVFQASIVTIAIGIIQVPYNASITSHEHMSTFAYISVANSIAKLGIVLLLLILPGDHLILYSLFLVTLSILFQMYYRFYCLRHFAECHISRRFNNQLFREMLSFSSWSMLESVSLTIRRQGINIFLNRFFGTLLNAAAGVASLVQGILYAFTNNVSVAFRPQIIKSYAAADYNRVNELIGLGTRFTSIITTLTTIPFIFNMDYIMSLWLEEVPKGAVIICQICLFSNLFNSFNPFVGGAVIASGKIKHVNVILAIQNILVLLATYVVLKVTNSYAMGYGIALFVGPTSTMIYALQLNRLMPQFSVMFFIMKIYLPVISIFFMSLGLAACLNSYITQPLLALVSVVMICTLFVLICAYYFIFNKYMREQVKTIIKSMIKR